MVPVFVFVAINIVTAIVINIIIIIFIIITRSQSARVYKNKTSQFYVLTLLHELNNISN